MKIKTVIRLALALVILALIASTGFYRSAYKKANEDSARYYQNLLGANFTVQKLEAKNGEAYYKVNALALKTSELEDVNSSLFKEIKNLKTKAKNLEAIIRLQSQYAAQIDSLPFRDTVFVDKVVITYGQYVEHVDPYLTFYARVDSLQLTDIRLTLSDTILISWETRYKGWWFWRKPVEVIAKLKNESPYLVLDKIETYRFKE